MLGRSREGRQGPLDRLDMDQAGVNRQCLVGVLAIEAEAHLATAPEHVEFAAKAISPGIRHPQDLDPLQREIEVGAAELARQHLALLDELFRVVDVL